MVNFSDNDTHSRAAQAAAVLARIVAENGRGVVSDPRRVDGLLRDYCPEARREVNLLTTALREGVAKELAAFAASGSLPMALLVPRLVGRLEQEHGMAVEAAQWSVETWAAALRPSAPVPTPEQRQAASWSHTESVRLLLEAGADVEARDKDGDTVLMQAAWNGHTEILRLLLQAAAEVDARATDGWTALMRAASWGQTESVRLLLEAGADAGGCATDGSTALMRAQHPAKGVSKEAKGQTIAALQEALNAKLVSLWTDDAGDYDDAKAMIIAPETIRAALDAGADVEARDKDGWTALMRAAYNVRFETVRLLLEAGAQMSTADGNGGTALRQAQNPVEGVSEEAKVRTVAVLKNALDAEFVSLWTGTDGNFDDAKAAAMTAEALRAALDAGADVEARDKDGRTALTVAAWNGHTELAQLLLEAGAEVDACATDGNTALMRAAWNGHTGIVRLLLGAAADLEAYDKYGWTALMRAAWSSHTESVHLLLQAGANVEARNTDGSTALMRAQHPAKGVSEEAKGQTIAALQEALNDKRGSLPSNSTKINKWLKTLLRPSS